MQHERIGVGAQFGDDEWYALGHQAGDEGDVARQPVKLGDDDRATFLSCEGKGFDEARASVQRIGALAGLDLGVLGDDRDALGLGEAYVGSAFVMLDRATRECFWNRIETMKSKKAPAGVKKAGAQWVRAGLVGRVKYLRGEGGLRHASLKDFGESASD